MSYDSFFSKVAGVTSKNDNGTSRQNYILAFCKSGMPLILKPEPQNRYDNNAIAVYIKARSLFFFTSEVQIGYLSAEIAAEFSSLVKEGATISGSISEITGGKKGKESLGVNIHLLKHHY